MKIAMAIAVSAVVWTNAPVLAQNASTGTTVTTGDSAVSPAAGDPAAANLPATKRENPAAGVNSGVLNNGTTGDTIGAGSGTSSAPSAGTAATGGSASGPAARGKE